MQNFTITLYAFHLRHTLAQTPNQVLENAHFIWDNLTNLGVSFLLFPGLKDLKSQLINYDNDKYQPEREIREKSAWLSKNKSDIDLGTLATSAGFKISGNLLPFLFNDTYTVNLTLSSESANQEINLPEVQYFQPSALLPEKIQASLGQTLLIYGEVEPQENCQDLADKLAVTLVSGTHLNPVLISSGELFESPLFIYQVDDIDEPNNPVKSFPILILLNNQPDAQKPDVLQGITDSDEWIMNLLCCYHKILFISYAANDSYQKARTIYSQLQQEIQDFQNLVSQPKLDIQDLEKLLLELPKKSFGYTEYLQNLEIQKTAIITNIKNYQICLDKITAINNNQIPQFWQLFLNQECQKWQEQIQTDINYLTPGQELFSQLIETIRGIVEIEQTKRDRSLERTIQVLGIGFGGGAIVSGVVVQHIDKIEIIKQPIPVISPNNPPNQFSSALVLSLLATFLFIGFGWVVTKMSVRK